MLTRSAATADNLRDASVSVARFTTIYNSSASHHHHHHQFIYSTTKQYKYSDKR